MTKTPFRRKLLNLSRKIKALVFKCWVSVLSFAAKRGLIVEHKLHDVIYKPDSFDVVPCPNIRTDRMVFNVSRAERVVTFIDEHWFNTKKGKRILTLSDHKHTQDTIEYRAELEEFFCHFSPTLKKWVSRKAPVVHLMDLTKVSVFEDIGKTSQFQAKTHHCDFSKCRFAFNMNTNAFRTPTEVISESYNELKRQLEEKVPEINEMLTGVKNDAQYMSPSGQPLAENMICSKCGLPVFMSSKGRYLFECMHHGEIEYQNGIVRVSKEEYEDRLKCASEDFDRFCPQDSYL